MRRPIPSVVERWFAGRGWRPFEYQRRAWSAYVGRAGGGAGLIHAPTGVGKSLAAWLGPVIEALGEGGERAAAGAAEALRVLWVTPMRALAGDTVAALAEPARALGLRWTVEARTGDTGSSVRRRQRERLPTALVTTPESLALLLSYPESRAMFATLRCVVVDEWHELLSTKRGTQTELALARLRRWGAQAGSWDRASAGESVTASARGLWTWGLSATLGNVEEAARVLAGAGAPRARVIRGVVPRAVEVETILPGDVERFPWAGNMGLDSLEDVVRAVERASSTLLFTNTRSQAEIWYRRLLEVRPEWLGLDRDGRVGLAIHHGSLDRGLRGRVEGLLKAGRVRCVVCTSSLDLGVDFSPVDQVIQVGSPKGVARLMQRAGRSGHQPGAVSRIVGVPAHAMELVEFAAARAAVKRGRVEARRPLDRPLDVLVQHLVTIAAGGGFEEQDLLEEVRSTVAFEGLTDREWRWAMEFVGGGGRALRAYPRFARLRREEAQGGGPDRYTVSSGEVARLHRMAIGTITAEPALTVAYVSGRTLGTIEESFIARLRPGSRFVFAGRVVEFVGLRGMTAVVARTTKRSGLVPRWNGGRFSLSTQLAAGVRALLDRARRGRYDGPEMALMRPLLELQARWSRIPAPGELLIEGVRTGGEEGGHHAFLFPFAGRQVQEGLGALLAHRLSMRAPCSVTATATDSGVELLSDEPIDLDEAGWRRLLSPEGLEADLLACLESTQMARRQFRDIARIAGLVVTGVPGSASPARHLQASSDMFFDVLAEFDPDNLLLGQARREVLEGQLDLRRLRETLERLGAMRLAIVRMEDDELSPLAFPIWAERLRSTHVTSREWSERIGAMALRLEAAADGCESAARGAASAGWSAPTARARRRGDRRPAGTMP
jgi:ATP-dependent Lhr-like helicase